MITAVTSIKGGVAKTTSAVSLAHALALRNESTLLVDLDPQGHCAVSLGMDPQPGIFSYLTGEPRGNCIRSTGRRLLDLLPSDSHARLLERMTHASPSIESNFRAMLGWLAWDHIIIDTPASGILQEFALRIAHAVVVPFRPESLALDGIDSTLAVIQQFWGDTQSGLYILPTLYDRRLGEHEYNLGIIQSDHGSIVVPPVPARVGVAEATAVGETIWEYKHPNIQDACYAYDGLAVAISLYRTIQETKSHTGNGRFAHAS